MIGDKNLSSWSLRPWLALKQCGIPFDEECIRLRQPDSKAEILRHSPSGKVPALKTRTGVVWDSLAILDYLAERHPEQKLWPDTEEARAAARSISAEMHSGFATLRNDMPMDLLSTLPCPPISAALEVDIRRIAAIWKDTRARFGQGGPYLFGGFSNADAMYAPVATRLPHLWRRFGSLRRRRHRRRLSKGHPGAPGDGRVDRGRQARDAAALGCLTGLWLILF